MNSYEPKSPLTCDTTEAVNILKTAGCVVYEKKTDPDDSFGVMKPLVEQLKARGYVIFLPRKCKRRFALQEKAFRVSFPDGVKIT